MSYRKKIFLIGAVFVLTGAASVLVTYIDIFNLCPSKDSICLYKLGEIGQPVTLGSISFIVILFILLFTKQAVFRSWLKFATPYLILSILLLAVAPTSNADIYGLDRELIAWFTSALFLVISLLIIGIKSWKLRGK